MAKKRSTKSAKKSSKKLSLKKLKKVRGGAGVPLATRDPI